MLVRIIGTSLSIGDDVGISVREGLGDVPTVEEVAVGDEVFEIKRVGNADTFMLVGTKTDGAELEGASAWTIEGE